MWNRPSPSPSPSKASSRRARRLGAGAALAVMTLSSSARAGVDCESPDTVYVAVDESAAPLVREAGWKLAREGSSATIVYQVLPGCAAVRTVVPAAACGNETCLKGTATLVLQDIGLIPPKDVKKIHSKDAVKDCALPAGGASAHVALSEVSAASCPAFAGSPPSGVVDLVGAVSPLALVTSALSPEQSIHAGEAYFIYGKGKDANVRPWLDEAVLVKRDPSSSLAVLFGLRLGVAPARLRGVLPACNGGLCVTESDRVIRTLGDGAAGLAFMSTAELDRNLGDLKPLAFQALGQRGAFWPDRAPSSFDKRNVRDGHYPLWGYLHVIGRADPVMPDRLRSVLAGRLADLVQGKANVAGVDLLDVQVRAGLVPACAMRVSRTRDTAPLQPHAPPTPCGCWFEKAVPPGQGQAQTRCTACTDDKACGAGRCRRGFCEDR